MLTCFRAPSDAVLFAYPLDADHTAPQFRRDYYRKTSGVDFGPEGFLVDLPPAKGVRPHFHPVDQFQVMFGDGTATYGREVMPHVLVHYTDGNTVYGPFASAAQRLQFFTLRAEPTGVTSFMPESRGDLPPNLRGDHRLADIDALLAVPLPSAGEVTLTQLFGGELDRSGAALLSAGPSAAVALPPAATPGRYCVVVAGHLVDNHGRTYGQRSLGWTQPDDVGRPVAGRVERLVAGHDGCRALLLQFGARHAAA
jgi:hypothetical protein